MHKKTYMYKLHIHKLQYITKPIEETGRVSLTITSNSNTLFQETQTEVQVFGSQVCLTWSEQGFMNFIYIFFPMEHLVNLGQEGRNFQHQKILQSCNSFFN